LYEGSARVGGKLRAGEVAGMTVDVGAESMLNRRPEGVAFAEAIGLTADIVHPATSKAGIWTRGAVRTLPPNLMGFPADLRALARSGILTTAGVGRASLERRLPEPDLSEDVGVGLLVAQRLGRDVRDRLVEPLLGGVYAGRADEISLYAALPQVLEAVRRYGGLLNAARATRARTSTRAGVDEVPVFAGIRGGLARLAQGAADQLVRQGARIECGSMVRELTRAPDGWQLVVGPTTRPRQVDVDAVVLAAPAPTSARLLREVAPVAANELGRIEYASVALVTVAVRASDMGAELMGSGFLVPPVDQRVIKAATFSSYKWEWLSGDTVVLRCSIGRHREERDLQRDDSELVDAAMTDLREATGLRAPLQDAVVTRWGGGLPQYAVGHLDRVRLIEQSVEAQPRLAVCGAALEGVGLPAVIANARRAATRVVDQLDVAETMEP
ncbi:MAG: protoporphyrinogen oxidase, partial [Nocardioidaceae bacterium]|nr:protoporphyrinogen oxidase [Nocardioidaceae bacterium]